MNIECNYQLTSRFLLPVKDEAGNVVYEMNSYDNYWKLVGTVYVSVGGKNPTSHKAIKSYKFESRPMPLECFTTKFVRDIVDKAKANAVSKFDSLPSAAGVKRQISAKL